MSGSLRLALILLAVVFGGWIAIKVTSALVGWIISTLVVPIVIIAAIGGIGYLAINRKSLSGGRRTLP